MVFNGKSEDKKNMDDLGVPPFLEASVYTRRTAQGGGRSSKR